MAAVSDSLSAATDAAGAPAAPGACTAFASAVMLRLLVQGMQSLGLQTHAAPPAQTLQGPHVQLAAKRALLQSAVAQGGLACLLQLGAQAPLEGADPIHRAMAAARGVDDLLARWGRLEPVVHRWHRVRVQQRAPGTLVLEHLSLQPGGRILPVENLVVLGLLATLLQRQGLQGLRASIAGRAVWPDASEPDLRALVAAGRTGVWHLEWNAQSAEAAVVPVTACVEGGATTDPADVCAGLPWRDEALRCATWIQHDLLRRPDLVAAAQALGLPRRSLQRALARAGLHFSGVVAEVRVRSAAWWLLQSALPIAEVGFVCGYADQAHFSRCFKQRTGWSPGAYRGGFGR